MKPEPYVAAPERYDRMPYRRTGRSGLLLPTISLGLWQNFGGERRSRRAARSCGAASTSGSPTSTSRTTTAAVRLGRGDVRPDLRAGLPPYRDELVISTKAGYDMWPGPYGEWGSRKYLLASLDQSLQRMGVDYVDIFYSHRPDPETPIEETMGALDTAVRQGKALYAGISSYSPDETRAAGRRAARARDAALIHQPSYSMFNRWIEDGLLDVLGEEGVGTIAFSPLAQGLLSERYLEGIPEDSRAARNETLPSSLSPAAARRSRSPQLDQVLLLAVRAEAALGEVHDLGTGLGVLDLDDVDLAPARCRPSRRRRPRRRPRASCPARRRARVEHLERPERSGAQHGRAQVHRPVGVTAWPCRPWPAPGPHRPRRVSRTCTG